MNTATIILLVLQGISLLLNAHLHGKPKTGEYNFWGALIAVGVILTLYYYAGLLHG
jgi:hypothetical protein